MKRFFLCLFLAVSSFPSFANEDFLLLPGVVSIFEYSEGPPALGFSLKGLGLSDHPWSLNSFEVRGTYSLRREQFRMDLTWPGFFGSLYPGVSADFDQGKVTPWFYAEVDFFYLPFIMFMSAGITQFIPSLYAGIRFREREIQGDLGVRLSFQTKKRKGE